MRRRAIVLVAVGWVFWTLPTDAVVSIQATEADPMRHGGFTSLQRCEDARLALLLMSRWRLTATPCLPE